MAEGHSEAGWYPLIRLWNEAEIARSRLDAQAATQAILFQSAGSSLVNKGGGSEFRKLVERLLNGQ